MRLPAVARVDLGWTVDAVSGVALQNPLVLVVVAAVGAVALLGVIWLLIRLLGRSSADTFEKTLAKPDEVAVLMHPNPDPDAMASAMAVESMARAVDTEATLQYPGQVRHQENRAFRTVLDLDMENLEDASEIAADRVVLVDHNEPRGFPGCDRIDPYAVVDHHPGGGSGQAFTDVRTKYGACATIFAEYFRDLDWEPGGDADDPATTLPAEVATALLFGIQADTNRLTKGCSASEFRAAEYLYPGVDSNALDRIANPEVDAEVLDVKARAIQNREIRGAFAYSNVGEVSNVDAIPQAADELLRLEGVTAVVVAGERDGTLRLSGRSRDDRVHMGRTLREAVEDIPMASAGGHARMGGGQLSLEHMHGIGPSAGLTVQEFREHLFAAMSGDV
ncbi:RNA-binding protein [Halobacteriales archaeon QS_1_68_17]|nr:MAG: RNA-binding protein [Halobacteriales archaeon QS_1_68_17]